jgi:hypothetical protein
MEDRRCRIYIAAASIFAIKALYFLLKKQADMLKMNYEKLFKLRLAIVRFGEMDCARWWNTQGVLGRYGALALGRGFPKTHRFAQAKIAFSVAAHRCNEVYSHPSAHTLWNLPPDIEDRFKDKWLLWLENSVEWTPFFQLLEDISGITLHDLLVKLDLLTIDQADRSKKMRPSSHGPCVEIPGGDVLDDESLSLLAAGFGLGEPGRPVIPYLPYETTRHA